MTSAPRTVLPLAEVGGSDRGWAGNKAAVLGELRRRGFPVPDAVVLRGHGEVSDADVDALDQARMRLGGCVAVRSSARTEDTATASAAGRYPTTLDVTSRSGVVDAVRACRAADPTMAVLVQRMVRAASGGVAFSADPVTGERDVVVVVAGPPGSVTEGGSGAQWRLRPDSSGPGLVREIARTAVAAAEVVGAPADLEWAVCDGRVVVLQARPMTALPPAVRWATAMPGGWLRNFRLGEWLPGPPSPLFDSWFVDAVEAGVVRRAAAEGGLVMRPPLHVTVEGWYFHAPLGTAPSRTLLGAVVRRPSFAFGSVLVTSRPEWTERIVARPFARRWREEVLPAHRRAAHRLAEAVASHAGPAELVERIDAMADAVGGLFWSLSMVGGFAWKLEAVLRRLLAKRLPEAEATHVAAWLAQPPVARGRSGAYAIESLDWVHPVRLLTDVPARRIPERPDLDAARTAMGARGWRRVERLGLLAHRYTRLREEQAAALGTPWPALHDAVLRLAAAAALADDDVWFLRRPELAAALYRTSAAGPIDVSGRRAAWRARFLLTPPLQLGTLPGPVARLLPTLQAPVRGALVTGQPAGPGRATGTVVVAADLAGAARLRDGQILVTALVTPAWLPVVARAAAVVTDGGTIAAHAALVARELGVPIVVATRDATRRLVDGETVTVDGGTGTVTNP